MVPARPSIHFTPPYGWMNDPNGLVFADGVYHLCYQHHPDDLLWGPMHWGHAVSRDLVAWEHWPVALVPDDLGTAFSGSAVVDHEGVAGFGPGALVAFYTQFIEEVPQCQSVAWSADGGMSWQTFAGNPVLRAPEGVVDFRDPKVLHLPGDTDRPWVMVLVAGEEVLFHRSADLVHWTPVGRFGAEHGAHGGVWETPDLFELAVEGSGRRRWVLTVSVQQGGPAGGSGTQYFVGDFDGETFVCEESPETVRWADAGADFYAPQSWTDAPDGRRVWLAWMSNWAYARDTPARVWRGAMSLPRELRLVRRDGRPVLAQRPVPELAGRARCLGEPVDRSLAAGTSWAVAQGLTAADVALSCPARASGRLVVELRRGAAVTRVVYDGTRGVVVVEPSPAGLPAGCRAGRQEALVTPAGDELDLVVLVDTTSVEVFADGGTVVLTNQVFGAGPTDVVLGAEAADLPVSGVRVRDLAGEGGGLSRARRSGAGGPG